MRIPLRLAMNLYETEEENRKYLAGAGVLTIRAWTISITTIRPWGPVHSYILEDLRRFTGGDVEEMKKYLTINPVPLSETLGTITGKYPAKDKITFFFCGSAGRGVYSAAPAYIGYQQSLPF